MGRLVSKLPLMSPQPPKSCKVNRQYGVEDFKYVVTVTPYLQVSVSAGAMPKTLYIGEVQSINLSYVEFANKTANIKCKNLSVYYTV